MEIEGLKALRETLRAWDAELRSKTCAICGRPVSGLVPTGKTAAEVGICTGSHSLYDRPTNRTWHERVRAVQAALEAEPGLPADRRRRVETCVRRARRAHSVATGEEAGPERVERESRRAWRWLVRAERFLAEARQAAV